MADRATINARLAQLVQGKQVPDGVIALDMGADGRVVIDGRQVPATVASGEQPADLTVNLSAATLEGLMDGSVEAQAAFMAGDIKVEGDIGLAMELAGLFQD